MRPVGAHRDLLAYLVRRLLENGANSSFVHQLADESVGLEQLLVSPLHLAAEAVAAAAAGPVRRLPAPNSAGVDLTVAAMRAPLLAGADQRRRCLSSPKSDVRSRRRPCAIWHKCAINTGATPLWPSAPPPCAAPPMRWSSSCPRFCALLVKEAIKTWGDAVAEVREAVDFLRYYADQAERIMAPHRRCPARPAKATSCACTARGVWVCISPWNFPLAIFAGQVAAALATGNTVLAKPAEQTPGVALAGREAAARGRRAGRRAAAAARPGRDRGRGAGGRCRASPAWCSPAPPQVARIINRALAAKDGPIVPLIAETGGINAMVVDSTALPEQVVDAVVQSAFRSRRPALLGAAPAVRARRHRRRGDRDDPGRGQGTGGGRPGRAGHRRRPGDRRARPSTASSSTCSGLIRSQNAFFPAPNGHTTL